MERKSIKETAMQLLEELCKNVPLGYSVQKDAAFKYINLAELADALIDEFGADNIFLDAASETDDGFIYVDTDEVIFEHGRTHPFFEYIKSADFLNFLKGDNGSLRIKFGVKGLVALSE